MGNNNEDDEFDEVLKGPQTITGAVNVAEYNTQFTIQPDSSFTGQGSFDEENVWYEENGGTVESDKPNETAAVLTTDGVTDGSRASLETPTLVYRPGTHVDVSGGVFIPGDGPTGDGKVEVLYGREPRTIVDPYSGESVPVGVEYAGFRLREIAGSDRNYDLEWVVGSDFDNDGVAEERVVPITDGDWGPNEYITSFDPPQSADVLGLDPFDGSGPSGISFKKREGYVFGIELGWYGPTSMLPYITEVGNVAGTWKQRKWPILLYNPNEAPAIRRPNQPLRINVDQGTSGQAIEVRVGGRKGAYRGDVVREPATKTHTAPTTTISTTGGTAGTEGLNWYVVGVVKSRAVDPDVVLAPNAPSLIVNNPAGVQTRIVNESDLSGTIAYDEPSNTQRANVKFAIDAAADTPDRVSVDTYQIDGEAKFAGVKVGNGLLSSGGKNKPELNEAQDFGFTIPRDKCLVYMIAAKSNSDVEVDVLYKVETTG